MCLEKSCNRLLCSRPMMMMMVLLDNFYHYFIFPGIFSQISTWKTTPQRQAYVLSMIYCQAFHLLSLPLKRNKIEFTVCLFPSFPCSLLFFGKHFGQENLSSNTAAVFRFEEYMLNSTRFNS